MTGDTSIVRIIAAKTRAWTQSGLAPRIGIALALLLAGVGIGIVGHEILSIRPDRFRDALTQTGSDRITWALVLTVLSYVALMGYDGLALRHLSLKVSLVRTAFASFASYSVSFNLGFPLVTGGAVRLWVYGPAGLGAGRVAALTLIAGVTFWLGMATIVAGGFLIAPEEIDRLNHFGVMTNRIIGAATFAALAAYVVFARAFNAWTANRHAAVKLPGTALTLGQTLLGVIDVCAAAGTLYVLLPEGHGLGFPAFCALYAFACMLGIASHVPGALGVFEATMFKTIDAPHEALLASLVLFRLVYYVGPFIVAAMLLTLDEIRRRVGSGPTPIPEP